MSDVLYYMYNGMEQDELLLKTTQVAEMLGVANSTLEHMRINGDGPSYVSVGRSVRYPLSSIYEWMAKRKRFSSTSDAAVTRQEIAKWIE